MTVYLGKLQMEGDPAILPADVRIDMGSLSIVSGQTPIGEWKLYQIGITEQDKWIVLSVEGERLFLDLAERSRFLVETATYHRDDDKKGRRRREPEHPAFIKDEPGPAPSSPTMAERARDAKQEVREEAAPLIAEGRQLFERLPRGVPLYAGIVALIGVAVFVPFVASLLFVVCMTGGILGILAGGIGYVEPGFGVRYPASLSPTRLMIIGAVLLVLAVPFALMN